MGKNNVFKRYLTLVTVIIAMIFLFSIIAISSNNSIEKITGKTIYEPETESILSVSLNINKKEVLVGDTVVVEIKIMNFYAKKATDALIEYKILNVEKNKSLSSSEMVAMQTSVEIVENIYIPQFLGSGTYIIEVIATHEDMRAKASDIFVVKKYSLFDNRFLSFFLIGLVIFLIFFAYFVSRDVRKIKKQITADK